MTNKKQIPIEDQSCGNCKFFYIGSYGVCRKYPPRINGSYDFSDKPISEFPPVDSDEWCGEWEEDE